MYRVRKIPRCVRTCGTALQRTQKPNVQSLTRDSIPNWLTYLPDDETSNENADVALTSHELAARLALFLWDDLPDEVLSAAADAQTLSDVAAIKGQAQRMLADPRARQTVRSFHRQWLDLARLEKVTKDPATFARGMPICVRR